MIGVATALLLSFNTPQILDMPAKWEPQTGDHLLVDIDTNTGYLKHTNGETLSFKVATGQKKWVYYIGRHYFAETPNKEWTAKSLELKSDHFTFGESGRFLRLYDNGSRTAYGIHPFKYEKETFSKDNRYISYGCVLVTEDIMDTITKTYKLNNNSLKVHTYHSTKGDTQKHITQNL